MTSATDQPAPRRPDRFAAGVRRAASRVLGTGPVGESILELCDSFESERDAILQTRVSDAVVIGVIGPTGQGKTWLVRQFVQDANVRSVLPSGDRLVDATAKIAWIGPQAPASINNNHERYLHCESAKLYPMGVDYLILDTPGATDQDPQIAKTAAQAISLASVHILVVKRDQLRTAINNELVTASEGTLVLPIINIVRNRDNDLSTDVDAYIAALKRSAPGSQILPPIIVPDFDITDDEDTVSKKLLDEIGQSLRPQLLEAGGAERRRRARIAAADKRFRESLNEIMQDEVPYLTRAVDHLHEAADRLPRDVANSLVGSGGSLRAGIRSRLRLALLTDTAAIWFPYKSLLGLLNLTHGAWDRLVLTLSGSLPSLITSAWTTAKNIGQMQSLESEMSSGVRQRSAALVRDQLGPLIRRFRQELGRVQPEDITQLSDQAGEGSQDAYLRGIDALQERSHRILEEEIENSAVSGWSAQILGLIGTVIFWVLLAGPIVALYHKYFGASYGTLTELKSQLDAFPAPKWAMMLTSLLLSVMPTAIYSMLVITFTQRNGRVRRCAEKIQARHTTEITRLQQEGVLRLEFDDPMLADAEFLVSVGKRRGD